MIRVVSYTNAAKAQLMLNGKQVGEIKQLDDKTGVIFWDIPYQEGKLEVTGLDKNDKPTCNYSIQSSGRPYAITVQSDLTSVRKDRGLAQIVVQIVDKNGVPVMNSEDEVTCTLEGPARLLGLESSNNTDMGNYRDNVQRVYHGRMMAYVQSSGKEGKVNLTFTAPWLKEAKVTIDVQN
jgi:beta-galactosidase